MAMVLNEAGQYTLKGAVSRFVTMIDAAIVSIGVLSGIIGYQLFGLFSGKKTSTIVCMVLTLAILGFARFFKYKYEQLDNERLRLRIGASGEKMVEVVLEGFPDEFYVIHGITLGYGDLDHVVIGPTGVFVIDTKNLAGIITPDGKGDLLRNGKPLAWEMVNPFVSRMMKIRKEIISLCKMELFFKAVLVFPRAWVSAFPGETGNADCVRLDKLWEYIVEKKANQRLSPGEIRTLANAFRSLTKSNKGFQSTAVN